MQGPSDDDVVEEVHVERDQNDSEANSCHNSRTAKFSMSEPEANKPVRHPAYGIAGG